MLKNLYRFAVCVNNLKNKLLMTKVLLNIMNIFIFQMMQSLKKDSLKNIMMIHYRSTLRLKKLQI